MTSLTMNPSPADLTVELRSADGSTTEFYQSDPARVREALALLAAPRLFAQPHLLLAAPHRADLIPCKGIDMIFARTSMRSPVKFPIELPAGQFDLVEQPEAWLDDEPASGSDKSKSSRRRGALVKLQTLGGWSVALKTTTLFHGNIQDERQWQWRLPEAPTIPFRLEGGGFGLINTVNIVQVTALPRPEVLPGPALPLALCQRTPPRAARPATRAS